MKLTRKSFLAALGAALAGTALTKGTRPPHLLLRCGWQTVNIGDIAHTPGMLRLLQRHLPDAAVTLWPSRVDNGVAEMLLKAFPKLKIVGGTTGDDGLPDTPELAKAWKECDFLLHGSGPSVVAHRHLAAWRRHTGKPFGIFGVTMDHLDDALRDLLNAARFVYLRDGVSRAVVERSGVTEPVVEFAPDAAFAFDLRNESAAEAWLKTHRLEPGKFVCAIPRLRYTPYFKIHRRAPKGLDLERDAVSEKFKEPDHAKLREALVDFARRTGVRLVACPEMTHELQLAREQIIDPLPDDVRKSAVWREAWWLPDEAASVYARALAVVSMEMHSPILAVAAGTPALHLRQPTDTSKAQMWRDIGLKDWIFEIETAKPKDIADCLGEIYDNPAAAKTHAAGAMDFVRRRHAETLAAVGRKTGGAG